MCFQVELGNLAASGVLRFRDPQVEDDPLEPDTEIQNERNRQRSSSQQGTVEQTKYSQQFTHNGFVLWLQIKPWFCFAQMS